MKVSNEGNMTTAPLQCRSCGTANPANAAFCVKCGHPLRPLNNRYRLIGDVDKGGMASVFKAEDSACFNRTVALKRFAPRGESASARQEVEENSKREAEILASLNHHSIPDLYDYFSSNDTWYLVMSFIEGETLEQRWQRARRANRIPQEETITIGIQLCTVLQYLHLHQQPIVFGDLKPANIMLGNDGHVYLIDFGSARFLRITQGRDTQTLGTPGFAAPELGHNQLSPRADIYSLGATLFQLTTGRRPSGSTSYSEKSSRNRVAYHGSPRLQELITRMMQEDEGDRPASIVDIQKELQEIENELTKPAPGNEKRGTTRRTLLMGGITGAAGLLAGGVATAVWFIHRPTPPPVVQRPRPVVLFPLTIGGKLDDEAALLTEMYVLLLQDAGFQVNDKARLGTNDIVFNAIVSGTIDIYPEFLLTGLTRLGIPTTGNQQRDFQNVQQGFINKYQITWLDQAVHLDDNYCVAMPKGSAARLGIKSLSDLAQVIKKQALNLKIAVAPDGETAALPALRAKYALSFTANDIISLDEKQTFAAVKHDAAQLNICIATDPLIVADEFLRLIDDKDAFPTDTPSPIIRNDILNREPAIATILNRLAPRLSVDVSTRLQEQMVQGLPAREVAMNWLKGQKLLPNS
jgi:osmoprotectant transport system substrate-binding protein